MLDVHVAPSVLLEAAGAVFIVLIRCYSRGCCVAMHARDYSRYQALMLVVGSCGVSVYRGRALCACACPVLHVFSWELFLGRHELA
jgi:hypothetical protein